MKRGQNGFGAVEALLFLILLSILGFTGYYVWHTSKNANSSYNNAAKNNQNIPGNDGASTYSNQSASYSLRLLAGWKFSKGQPLLSQDGQVETDYQGKPIIQPDEILPPGVAYEDISDTLQVYTDDSSLSAVDYYNQNGAGRAGSIVSQDTNPINGYDTYSAKVTMGGGTYYVITLTRKGKVVEFNYYITGKYTDGINSVIKSIKFTN